MTESQNCSACGLRLDVMEAVEGMLTCLACKTVKPVVEIPPDAPQVEQKTSALAIWSLVTGALCFGPIGLFLGILALNDIRHGAGRKTGKALAWVGIGLGAGSCMVWASFVFMGFFVARQVQVMVEKMQPVMAVYEIKAAQDNFRLNDGDSNGEEDYWTGDVAGLWNYTSIGKSSKIANLANADPNALPAHGRPGVKEPYFGYWICAMTTDPDGQPYGQDPDGDGVATTNPDRYGFCIYPATYVGKTLNTYIFDEHEVVWQKDIGGQPQLTWPDDPESDGWVPGW